MTASGTTHDHSKFGTSVAKSSGCLDRIGILQDWSNNLRRKYRKVNGIYLSTQVNFIGTF
jgi:hypothetical protein